MRFWAKTLEYGLRDNLGSASKRMQTEYVDREKVPYMTSDVKKCLVVFQATKKAI